MAVDVIALDKLGDHSVCVVCCVCEDVKTVMSGTRSLSMIGHKHNNRYTVDPLYKDTPEMRIHPLIRTLNTISRVSGIERFHCRHLYLHSCRICRWIYTCTCIQCRDFNFSPINSSDSEWILMQFLSLTATLIHTHTHSQPPIARTLTMTVWISVMKTKIHQKKILPYSLATANIQPQYIRTTRVPCIRSTHTHTHTHTHVQRETTRFRCSVAVEQTLYSIW